MNRLPHDGGRVPEGTENGVNGDDQEGWIRALVERHEKPLCRYAYSLSGSLAAAQDAVQETFLRLCRVERDRIAGHEAAWLFRVCRSRVLDMKRKEKPVTPLSDEQEATLASAGPSPAEDAMRNDASRLVPRLMNRLPEKQREVIRLKFQQNLSYKEIAGILDLSETNVGYLIHTGIRALRADLQRGPGGLS